ncbi:MAG: HNH endonuclease [Candidatus Peribacteraceae bacterium]|nr:HNH endonuclease [Candidatus Peribacteraceae bacterium]
MKNREYIRIRIKHRGVTRSLRAHRVVYICVFGLPGPDMEIDHVWGPKWFNRPDNLEAVTGAENVRRAYKTGKCNPHNERCDRGRYRKKTDEDVRQELEDENESAPF